MTSYLLIDFDDMKQVGLYSGQIGKFFKYVKNSKN